MLQADEMITLGAGQYRLRQRLGGSAYGIVWRATGPHGEVALKLVNTAQMGRADPLQQGRWSSSAHKEIAFLRALAPWDERHIVRLLDSGEHQGLPVMALELMERDLGAHLAAARISGDTPGLAQILDWLGQVNQALAKVHQHGWRYLDLKPGNVLLDAAGKIKLADFGTSERSASGAAQAYAGTASWQAPEQFFPAPGGGYASDARSDYFALGALFYYLVTGGTLLRFCQACADAYREHHAQGAAVLLERHAGAMPVTLDASEASLFAARFGALADGGADDATWCPASARAGQALELLRALLAVTPEARPANALHISRLLAGLRLAAPAGLPIPQRFAAVCA